MIRLLTMGFVLMVLVMFGCGQSEESKSQQEPKETAAEKMTEAVQNAAGEVKESAESVAEKAGEVQKQAEPAINQAVEDTREMAASTAEKTEEMANQAADETKQVMADAKETMNKAADKTAEKASEAAVATTMAAEEAVETAKQAVSPETIVLEASFGNVTFPHAMHQGSYACATCHGEGTPGLFGLDKEKAHALCKDCHKKEAAGPTACKDCHKK